MWTDDNVVELPRKVTLEYESFSRVVAKIFVRTEICSMELNCEHVVK